MALSKTTTTMTYITIRIDTPTHGWILSRHRTRDAAVRILGRLQDGLRRTTPDAIPELVYTMATTTAAVKLRERIRYA